MEAYGHGCGEPPQSIIEPLVTLLQQELEARGESLPGACPASLAEFTHWYLQVVQLLEAQVAAQAGLQPMARLEVELMCRCALTARDLRQAIALVGRFCHALSPRAGKIKVQEGDNRIAFRLDSLRVVASSASSLCDITGLFAFHQLFQWLVGVDLQLRQVRIGPVERADVLPFLKLFAAPVLAGGEAYVLEYPAAILDLPVIRKVAEFDAFFEVYPCGVFYHPVNDLAAQVAAVLGAAASQGAGLPTQEKLARSMGLPLSTFRRRLAGSGRSFRELREDCLREQARILLARGEYTIGDIASRLGFSDAAAFRRAFRQWQGCSPLQWRRSRMQAQD